MKSLEYLYPPGGEHIIGMAFQKSLYGRRVGELHQLLGTFTTDLKLIDQHVSTSKNDILKTLCSTC